MIIQVNNIQRTNFGNIGLRCPRCGRDGTFMSIGNGDDLSLNDEVAVGHRICPNPKCNAYVLVLYSEYSQEVITTFPAERIDFDTTNIPEGIKKVLDEAISCHSISSFTASAIMIRRTLEEICKDKGATGKNLKEKIKSLSQKIIIPQELISGMDELRLLGNDAAHVEANVFEHIGETELKVAINFTKEIIKAIYQYSSLLAELKELKKKRESATDKKI